TLIGCPVDRSEGVQVVAVGQGGQPGEDVSQVSMRVLPMALAGDDDRVDDGGSLAGIGMAYKEPVLLADGRWADGVLDEVVVEAGLTVAQVFGQRRPVAEQVIAGLAEEGLRPGLRPLACRNRLEPAQRPIEAFCSQLRAHGGLR